MAVGLSVAYETWPQSAEDLVYPAQSVFWVKLQYVRYAVVWVVQFFFLLRAPDFLLRRPNGKSIVRGVKGHHESV